MALGAAFYAANMSKIFRVRPVHVYDWFNLDIFMEIYNEDNLLRK